MKFHGEARFVANEAEGYLSLKTTLSGAGAVIVSTAAYAPARGERTPVGGKMIFWYVARMSSLVIFEPSWNFTSVRSLMVYVSLSAETSGIAAATSAATLVRSLGSNLYSVL